MLNSYFFQAVIIFKLLNFLDAVTSDAVSIACAEGQTGCDVPAEDKTPKCGTFLKYNPGTYRILPDVKGFPGGVSFRNTTQYVGFGSNYCDYPNQIPCPAAVETTENKAGGYMFCDGTESFDYWTVNFLKKHPDLKWIDADINSMFTIPDVLQLPGQYYKYFFGRYFYQGEYRLGRVHLNRKNVGFYMQDEKNKELFLTEGFQVLTCPRCKNGGKGRYCCTNNANNPDCCENGGYGPRCTWRCGQQLLLSQFSPDDPQTPGFRLGTYYDGTKVYVGTGYFVESDVIDTARIVTEQNTTGASLGPGAYADDGYWYYDAITAMYFVEHPKLKWRKIKRSDGPPDDAVVNYLSFYAYADAVINYFVRINITRDGVEYQEIGSYFGGANAKDWYVCWFDGQYSKCSNKRDMDLDILVCLQTYNV